jgi:peptidoglycan L-alanyl-D-glutamate endopeptidase CwlK
MANPLYDLITIERIKSMHPLLRDELTAQYLEINRKLPKYVRLRFTHTYRSIEEQNALYAQGRTTKGNIVTNAKGGSSFHNYGLAFDIAILLDNDKNGTFESISYAQDENFMKVVNFFKSKGWIWGGDFKSFKDNPHFQKTFGNSISDLKIKKTFIDNGKKYPAL